MNFVIGDRQLVKQLFCIDAVITKVLEDSDPLLYLCLLLVKNVYSSPNLKLYAVSMLNTLSLSATASDPAPSNT